MPASLLSLFLDTYEESSISCPLLFFLYSSFLLTFILSNVQMLETTLVQVLETTLVQVLETTLVQVLETTLVQLCHIFYGHTDGMPYRMGLLSFVLKNAEKFWKYSAVGLKLKTKYVLGDLCLPRL